MIFWLTSKIQTYVHIHDSKTWIAIREKEKKISNILCSLTSWQSSFSHLMPDTQPIANNAVINFHFISQAPIDQDCSCRNLVCLYYARKCLNVVVIECAQKFNRISERMQTRVAFNQFNPTNSSS